ncbi:MAG TPA: CsbD family protein, partial [Savagea sp.]
MNKDHIKGTADEVKGNVKEAAGKATGDSSTEAKGKLDQLKG